MDQRRPPTAPPLLHPADRRRLITPFRVALGVALLGSLIFIAVGFVNRTTTQIPILSAGLAVLGLTLGALAVASAVAVVRAGRNGREAQAFWIALGGGVTLLAAAGALAAAVILALVWGSANQ
jgi:flagellar biosynthesis protein FliR